MSVEREDDSSLRLLSIKMEKESAMGTYSALSEGFTNPISSRSLSEHESPPK